MSEKDSFPFRIAAKHEHDAMLIPLTEDELFELSHRAVGEIVAGMTVKAQINAAWINLGKPPMWRLLSAWYRDGSGSWSAQAVRDFQRRFLEWQEREASKAGAARELARTRRAASDRALLQRMRDEHAAHLRRIEARLTALDGLDGLDP